MIRAGLLLWMGFVCGVLWSLVVVGRKGFVGNDEKYGRQS